MGTQKITEKQSKSLTQIEVKRVEEKNSNRGRRARKVYKEICTLEMRTLREDCQILV